MDLFKKKTVPILLVGFLILLGSALISIKDLNRIGQATLKQSEAYFVTTKITPTPTPPSDKTIISFKGYYLSGKMEARLEWTTRNEKINGTEGYGLLRFSEKPKNIERDYGYGVEVCSYPAGGFGLPDKRDNNTHYYRCADSLAKLPRQNYYYYLQETQRRGLFFGMRYTGPVEIFGGNEKVTGPTLVPAKPEPTGWIDPPPRY